MKLVLANTAFNVFATAFIAWRTVVGDVSPYAWPIMGLAWAMTYINWNLVKDY